MTAFIEPYHKHVAALETGLATYAKRSFESFSPTFLDGQEIHKYFSDQWAKEDKRPRLLKRTPLQIERDRVLYSSSIRKQTEKYHVLYNGQRRIVRNYITHTMRMMQVTRAISRGLDLNADFAEAIALGSKAGALPFVHASKNVVSNWIKKKVSALDSEYARNDPAAFDRPLEQLRLDFGESPLPHWLTQLRSPRLIKRVLEFIPWAAGLDNDEPYSTGKQSYWQLSTNPYTVESRPGPYTPETMFGVWRHSRGSKRGPNSFHHRRQLQNAPKGFHEISWTHCTYESVVVQYADDITWVIENLNDANQAALLNGRTSVYEDLKSALGSDLNSEILRPIADADAGGLYSYFINDFITSASHVLGTLGDGAYARKALRERPDGRTLIGLSEDALRMLDGIATFLRQSVFEELRVRNRLAMLSTISGACMDLLYAGTEDFLPRFICEKAVLERWKEDQKKAALSLMGDDVHRIQLAVDIFADMGDQEIYDFVGIDAL